MQLIQERGEYACSLDARNKINSKTFIPPDTCKWKKKVDSDGKDLVSVLVSQKTLKRLGANKDTFDKVLTSYMDRSLADEEIRINDRLNKFYGR